MATRSNNASLSGLRVLICRPQPDADLLADHLKGEGAQTRVLPLLERRSLPDTPQRRTMMLALDEYRHVIAVSPGAARAFVEYAEDWWPQWPIGLNWYGVGSGTADILREAGLTVTVPPDGFTSEHLLALPSLAKPAGERILIAKGVGGRELLGQTLQQRQARVDKMELYARVCPDYPTKTIDSALTAFDPHAIIVLSGETLNNLIALGENTDHNLKLRNLLVPVAHVAETARAVGFERVHIPQRLTPEGLIDCLMQLN
ncbi:uroporphyrinogen-III synthase [Marinobacter fonticola]|uniref:uroporphyrinogen-III synthase n=1 Tax=Marinobacter fonticola TaxID=2603215 RepID=UPI0011E68DD1|nr:uroporphyrinogen-III synthase [Marinobacter fonticola]